MSGWSIAADVAQVVIAASALPLALKFLIWNPMYRFRKWRQAKANAQLAFYTLVSVAANQFIEYLRRNSE